MNNCSINNCPLSNGNDSQTYIILKQLKRELEELTKDTTVRLLAQDGKIAEMCVYIKDNLSLTIREMLDTMETTGELDKIITETVLNSISLLEDIVQPIGNVKRYGAVGDGVSDDTLSFKTAIDEALSAKMPFVVPPGKYKITENLTTRGIRSININGEIINGQNEFEIGGDSGDGSPMHVKIQKINTLRVVGLKNAIIDVDWCGKMRLYANGNDKTLSSIGYCQFYGAYCNEIIIESSGDEIAWINENVFRIKRIEKITMAGNYSHNNNHFEHINFERGILNLENARNNYFSARCEGGITVTSVGDSQANFIEREYYYRHYFGDDVEEDNHGTVTFYPVNKLQTEYILLKIDKNNKHFPVDTMRFNENGLFYGDQYTEVFRSDLVPIDKSFSLKMKCNSSAMRVQMNFYDENKNRIITEVNNFSDGKMSFAGEHAEWLYGTSANVDNDTVCFYPGEAKYVEYRVIFGTGSVLCEFIQVKLLKYINTDVVISNTLKFDIFSSVPTLGYWEQGTILYAKSPRSGTSIGIVCVESGTPGVWKNFGSIVQ